MQSALRAALLIETYVIHGAGGGGSQWLDARLRHVHRTEYEAILEELNPSWLARERRERERLEREEQLEEKRRVVAEQRAREHEHRMWTRIKRDAAAPRRATSGRKHSP